MAQAIVAARQSGLKVGILLLAGMRQWEGPAESGNAGTFSALDRKQLQTRLSYIRKAVQGLDRADRFVFFAGDPGGDPLGRSTVHDTRGWPGRSARSSGRMRREQFAREPLGDRGMGGIPLPNGA